MSMKHKRGLITGGASGLGEGAVRRLVSEGASVVIADRDRRLGEALVADLRALGGEAAFFALDVNDPKAAEELVQFTVDTFGGLDFAVNNAGYGHGVIPFAETTLEIFEDQIGVHMRGTFLGMRAQIRHMLNNGGGSIVNVASVAALRAIKGTGVYAGAKAGVIGMSRAAALDYVKEKIRVNVIAPGPFLTPLMKSRSQEIQDTWAALTPGGRLGDPSEFGGAVRFLVSDDSSYVSGVTIPVANLADQG